MPSSTETTALTGLEEAREAVIGAVDPLGAADVALSDARGLVLAGDVVAELAVPGFDNATMDGFAVRAADLDGAPVRLAISDEARAGHPATGPLRPGQACRISTGAPIPTGADAVIPVEETSSEDGQVEIDSPVVLGRFVRRAGEDVAAGETLIRGGERLGPAQLGVLAAQGIATVPCYRRPRVALLTSGDELVAPGTPLPTGAIYDSNGFSIAALVEESGAELIHRAWTGDGAAQTKAAIATALSADALVICGGVSVGEHDHVKAALRALGVERRFWGVALRPGKPTWFGTYDTTPVFGLPGNPVSAMVCFLLLVRPALAVLAGARPEQTRTTAVLTAGCERIPGRTHAVRCRLALAQDGWHVTPAPEQASHVLTSMLEADCLAMVPADTGGRDGLRAGDRVEIELIGPVGP